MLIAGNDTICYENLQQRLNAENRENHPKIGIFPDFILLEKNRSVIGITPNVNDISKGYVIWRENVMTDSVIKEI